MQVQFHNAGLANLNRKSRASWEACRAPVPVMYAQCESLSTFPPDLADVLVPPASIDTPPLPAASSPTLCCKMNLAGWIVTYLGETNLSLSSFQAIDWPMTMGEVDGRVDKCLFLSTCCFKFHHSKQAGVIAYLDMTQDKDVPPSN